MGHDAIAARAGRTAAKRDNRYGVSENTAAQCNNAYKVWSSEGPAYDNWRLSFAAEMSFVTGYWSVINPPERVK